MFGGGGFGAQQPAQQGLFGGGGAFGQTPSTPAPAFGQQQQQPQQGFGGFGSAPAGNTAFGAPAPAFGSTGGLFGAPAAPAATGFSFGATNTGFGAPATSAQPSGGLFGAKPATTFGGGFGAPPATGGGLFGQSSPSSFGAAPTQPGQGTANPAFQSTSEKDAGATTTSVYQSISAMPAYKSYSFDELRLQDYAANRKHPTANTFGGGASSFGAPQQPAFGSTAPAPNMFGAQPNAFGTPAQPARLGFGATPTSGGLFGGGGGFGQPQQPASTGLFGAPAAPASGGGLFGGGGGGGFGAPAAPAFGSTAGGGLFGQPKPAASTFAFNQPAAPAMGTGGGLFGQPAPAANTFGQPAAPSGGLFGQPAQPPPAAGGFSFGAPKPLFGAPSPGAFSATPAAENKPAFGFGQPAATGGLFGSQPQAGGFGAPAAPQQSLFGGGSPGFGQPAAPAFGGGALFGAKPAAPVGGSLFGAPAPAPGLFGAQSQAPGLFSGGLGSSFGGGLSTASQQQQQQPPYQQQQQQQQLYASVDDNAYGSNPLFANIGAQAIPVNVLDSKKKPPISTAFRATPKSSSKITRLRGFGSSSLSSPGLNLSMNQSPRSLTSSILGTPGSNGRGSPLNLISGIGEEALLSSNAFVSRPSVKKLVIDKKVMGEASLAKSRNRSTLGATVSPQAAPPQRDPNSTGAAFKTKDRVTFNPDLDFSTSRSQYTVAPSSLRGPDTFGSSTPVKKASHLSQQQRNESFESTPPPLSSSLHGLVNDESISSALDTTNDLPAHGEYYTIPSIKHLYKLPAAKLQSFPDLVVGRVGYGKVSFHESVNLTTLSSVDRLLGDVIIFEDRNCTVYPLDYEGKPSPGDGLNVPATIQLERCWPVSKSTREPIKAEADPKLISHIKRLRNLEGTRFVDFESETGKWTFEVEGF